MPRLAAAGVLVLALGMGMPRGQPLPLPEEAPYRSLAIRKREVHWFTYGCWGCSLGTRLRPGSPTSGHTWTPPCPTPPAPQGPEPNTSWFGLWVPSATGAGAARQALASPLTPVQPTPPVRGTVNPPSSDHPHPCSRDTEVDANPLRSSCFFLSAITLLEVHRF